MFAVFSGNQNNCDHENRAIKRFVYGNLLCWYRIWDAMLYKFTIA